MSQQKVKEREKVKQTPKEIRHYLLERYKQASNKKIDIIPPKISRNSR